MNPADRDDQVEIKTLFETSWEVCNKIGGIYTVLSTKARVLQEKYGDSLIFIGPDVWKDGIDSPYFKEQKSLFKNFSKKAVLPFEIKVRSGKWKVPGSPQVILVDFQGVYSHLDHIFKRMWDIYQVDSLHEYGDYREGCAFSIAVAEVIKSLTEYLGISKKTVTAHFNEWTTGMGLLHLQSILPEAATLFTTHATSIGRSICGNGKALYDYFDGYDGDQMARELNMEAKHSLEKKAAHHADCFTAVSELTAKECEKLLEIRPQVVAPNGFEPDFVPGDMKYKKLREQGRKKIINIVSALKNKLYSDNVTIIATAGRNEYRNKGLDLFIDSIYHLRDYSADKEYIALILVPAWVREPDSDLKTRLEEGITGIPGNYNKTHILNNEESDLINLRLNQLQNESYLPENISIVYVPCYLDGRDGIVNISYYDLIPAFDITVFCSYYEPWGYTPLESIAFGIPTITTDKSGFGQWILDNFINSVYSCGVKVVGRTDSNYLEVSKEIGNQIHRYAETEEMIRQEIMRLCRKTSSEADWKYFIRYYEEAFGIASSRRNKRIEKSKTN